MADIRYISTRGTAPTLAFDEAVLAGLASDGGLYVPDKIPTFTSAEIAAMRTMSYRDLAYTIISRFTGSTIPAAALKKIIDESYGAFDHPDIAPLHQLDEQTYILELFHGPTLAFKDFALQFLGRLLEHIIAKKGEHLTIVGATSGDTGSAAIDGCRARRNMDIFILFPHGRVSDVQRRQMTTVADKNVHNIALQGTFDDCQNIVKALFNDKPFREKHHLTAVNSINWARIVAQIPYYFYAALKLGAPEKRVSFSVPTGNFGDIYAGYVAKKMGLPIDQLIIATNSNDILTRCLDTGIYRIKGSVTQTMAPSMDIQVSSNFERLLFDLYGRKGKNIATLMNNLKQKKFFKLSSKAHTQFKKEFVSASIKNLNIKTIIGEVYKTHKYLIDPHTAVGVAAGVKCRKGNVPLIVLATAHPAKFPDAVQNSTRKRPTLPKHLSKLFKLTENFVGANNKIAEVKRLIKNPNDLYPHHS